MQVRQFNLWNKPSSVSTVQAFAALVYAALGDLTPSGAHMGYDMGRKGN